MAYDCIFDVFKTIQLSAGCRRKRHRCRYVPRRGRQGAYAERDFARGVPGILARNPRR